MHHTFPKHRRGFTLVEIMVVIVILSILIALVLPAIGRARLAAQEAGVRGEISQLESAITAFKLSFGVEPPSRIVLYEKGSDWTSLSAAATHRATIRRIWPQFNFALDRDINGDGDMTDILSMNSGECLLFFLGGIMDGGPAGSPGGTVDASLAPGLKLPPDSAPTGFSKNPSNPFARGGNREGPFFEFDIGRFVDSDIDTTTLSSKPNGICEYLDSLPGQTLPLLYFSSYEGQGYRVTGGTKELPVPWLDDKGKLKNFTDVYRVNSASAHKPQSFQIISPGMDHQYGIGGTYSATNAQLDLASRQDEFDNITNFSGGRLFSQ